MTWTIERYVVNDKSGWKSGQTRHAEYRVTPVAGGYRLNYRMLRDSVSSPWKASEKVQSTAVACREYADAYERLFSFPAVTTGPSGFEWTNEYINEVTK